LAKQDPTNEIVVCGTTEGLWKTTDLGKQWKRVSSPRFVVNDVMVDPGFPSCVARHDAAA